MNKGLVIVLSAPSGGGKGTILKELFKKNDNLSLSVSATTRKPRPGEIDGVHYHFISANEFETLIEENKMLEYATYNGNYYGTPKESVEKIVSSGKDAILEIEVQGGSQIKEISPECVSIFILPPSMEVLESRLRGRGTEDDETIKNRLNIARRELTHAKYYDYVVVNDNLEDAVEKVNSIILAEKCKYVRNTNIDIINEFGLED